jgi:hypothetical protein
MREEIMSARRRALLLSLSLAAAAAPAFGQTAVPAAGPVSSGTQSAASIPDFSGIWAHPYLTGFEPPPSGPGPVRNKSRLPNGVANFQLLVGDYTNPILKPEAAEIVRKHGDISLAGKGYPTPSNQCWPGGVPYVFWDFLMQMFQLPDHITMVYRHDNEVRRVRMNQPHPAQVTPSRMRGSSRCPGRRRSPIGATWGRGRNSSAPRTPMNIIPERMPKSRTPTGRISEGSLPVGCVARSRRPRMRSIPATSA